MYRFIWKIKLNEKTTNEEFKALWRDSSTVLQEYQGAGGTSIHEAANEECTFFMVAHWESREARDAMEADLAKGESERAKRFNAFPASETMGDHQAIFEGTEIGAVTPTATQ